MSGYQWCACRDCFELACGEPGDFCVECVEAGCPDDPGECQRPDAYGIESLLRREAAS